MLLRRDKAITGYINQHYTMLVEFEKNRNSMYYFGEPSRNANPISQLSDSTTKKTLINLNFSSYKK